MSVETKENRLLIIGGILIVISIILIAEQVQDVPPINTLHFLNIQILLIMGISCLRFSGKRSTVIIGDALIIRKNRKNFKTINLLSAKRITRGLSSIKIHSDGFEEILFYSDFDKVSVKRLKSLSK